MITKEEWKKTAELAAAAKHGQEHSSWITFRMVYAVPVAIAAALGAGGLGGFLLWSKVVRPLFGGYTHISGGLPTAVPVLAVILLLATIVAFRPKRMPSMFHVLVIKVFVIGSAWLGLAAWTIAYLTS